MDKKSVVVAWQPDKDDLEMLLAGRPIFMMVFGGLAPHLLSMTIDKGISTS